MIDVLREGNMRWTNPKLQWLVKKSIWNSI